LKFLLSQPETYQFNCKLVNIKIKDTPGPTDYDVTNAFENLVKLKREKPRSKEAQKRQESFNFASKRFDNGQTIDEDAVPGTTQLEQQNKLVI
jgi:hypothetical protein